MNGGEIGTWLGVINGTAGVLGTLLGGFIVGRVKASDERWMMLWPAIATVGAAPALVGFLLAPSATGAMLCYWAENLLLGFHLGPCFAMVQTLTKARMRALASAITNLLCSLVGAGLGPGIVGAASDLMLPRFGNASVRYSLLLPALLPLFGAMSFWCAAWFLRGDLARTEVRELSRAAP
jgi:MFS family permease